MEQQAKKNLGGFSFKCLTMGSHQSKQYCFVFESQTGTLGVSIYSLVLVKATEEYKGFTTLRTFKDVKLIARHSAMQVRSMATILSGVQQLLEDSNHIKAEY